MKKPKKVDPERLITFTLFCGLYPRKKKARGVKPPYLYKLMGEKTSEKKRIHPHIIEISGVKFIYLNDYALNLLKLTFEEVREKVSAQLSASQGKPVRRPAGKPGETVNPEDDLYIED